ncbi:hypothetical protein [Blastococcus sp. CT_GayMR16]|nr:hypothetical protein [Blastococcus sp. CT_GayMR16]
MYTVTWWENGRRLQDEFATRDAARRSAAAIAARQRAEKKQR